MSLLVSLDIFQSFLDGLSKFQKMCNCYFIRYIYRASRLNDHEYALWQVDYWNWIHYVSNACARMSSHMFFKSSSLSATVIAFTALKRPLASVYSQMDIQISGCFAIIIAFSIFIAFSWRTSGHGSIYSLSFFMVLHTCDFTTSSLYDLFCSYLQCSH